MFFIAVPDALSAHFFAIVQDLHGIEVLLAPMQQFARLILAPFRTLPAHDHRNQPALTIDSRGNQVKSGTRRVPGFESVDLEGLIP
ncbi:hypothetical protein D3C72_2147280 [compost metagenome]